MRAATLRRVLHAGTASLLVVAWYGGWQQFRFAVHAILLVAVIAESLRLRNAAFRTGLAAWIPVFRPEEARLPCGAFWLITGYSLASWFPPSAAMAGVLSAAWADPAASWVGSRWGSGKPKSWAGTAAAWTVATGILLGMQLTLPVVVAGSVTAAVLERISRPLDDNVVIAPGVAAVVAFLG